MKFVTITLAEYVDFRAGGPKRRALLAKLTREHGECMVCSPGGIFLTRAKSESKELSR